MQEPSVLSKLETGNQETGNCSSMETLFSRYRNVTILVAVLFLQVLGLAVQVKRGGGKRIHPPDPRLDRQRGHSSGKGIVWVQNGIGQSLAATTSTCAECGRKIAI